MRPRIDLSCVSSSLCVLTIIRLWIAALIPRYLLGSRSSTIELRPLL